MALLGSAPGCFPQDELCRVNLTPEGLPGDAPTCFSSLVAQNCPQELLGGWTWGCGGHTLEPAPPTHPGGHGFSKVTLNCHCSIVGTS